MGRYLLQIPCSYRFLQDLFLLDSPGKVNTAILPDRVEHETGDRPPARFHKQYPTKTGTSAYTG